MSLRCLETVLEVLAVLNIMQAAGVSMTASPLE